MAEALLRQRLEAVGQRAEVRSAGVAALRQHPADPPACALMQARGLDLSPHRASQVTLEHTRWADLILVMESAQRDALVDIDPTARGKTYLLGHWIKQEVPDPYLQPEAVYSRALQLIDESLDAWMNKL